MTENKPIVVGRQAKNHLPWRKFRESRITEADVGATIRGPDAVTPSHDRRTNAWARHGEQWLRVTYAAVGERIEVVTVTLRKRGPDQGA